MLEIDFKKEVFNDAFFPLLFDTARIECLKGSAGSGKSWFLAQKWVKRFLEETNHRVPLVRKVGKTIRDSQYKLIQDVINQWGVSEFFDIRDSDMRIKCVPTNCEFFALGVDDKEKIKSLQKPTGMWIEEVTELSYSEYRQLLKRMRGKITDGTSYKQLTLSFNPIEDEHWIHNELFPPEIDQLLFDLEEKRSLQRKKKYKWFDFGFKDVCATMEIRVKVFFKGKEETALIPVTLHHSTYEDNAHLELDDIAILEEEKEKDYNSWLIYAKGRWGSIGNLVFNPMWRIKELQGDAEDVVYGMDFGFNHPSTLVKCSIKDGDWYVEELAYLKRTTNQEFIEYVDGLGLPSGSLIYADSAEPARIKEWQENSQYDVRPAIKGKDSVKAGIDFIKSINVYTNKKNYNLNRELKSYKWKIKEDGTPIDEPLPLNDDCIKGAIYGIYSYSKQNSMPVGFI